jgi:hypothetical protein
MGLWKSIKGVGKKVLGGIGDVAKYAAPVAALVPGVGTLTAAGLGLGGGLLGQLNDKNPSLSAGLKQGALSAGAAGTLGSLGGGGTSFLGNAGNAIKGVGNQLFNPYGGGIPGVTSQMGGTNPLLNLALGAVDTVSNARDATRYRGIEDEQIAYAKAQQARKQMFEDQVMGNLNKPLNMPDYTSTYEDTSNPFYKPRVSSLTAAPGVGSTGGGVPGVGGATNLTLDPTGPGAPSGGTPAGNGLAGYEMPLTRGGPPATEDQQAQANRVMAFLRPQGGGGMQVRARMA